MSRHPYLNTLIINIDPATAGNRQCPLLAIIDKYGVLINQRYWFYPALLEVSRKKIALWINVCADDWTAERAIIASDDNN